MDRKDPHFVKYLHTLKLEKVKNIVKLEIESRSKKGKKKFIDIEAILVKQRNKRRKRNE